jgi:diguanylate cyclase (GGDEF)-like protein
MRSVAEGAARVSATLTEIDNVASIPARDTLRTVFNSQTLEATMPYASGPDDMNASGRHGPDRPSVFSALASIAAIAAGAVLTIAESIGSSERVRLISIAATGTLAITAVFLLIVRRLSQQHKLSDKRLKLENAHLENAVNNMRQGLIYYDGDARVVIVNRRYNEIYGLSDEIVKPGCTLREVVEQRHAAGALFCDKEEYYNHVLRNRHLKQYVVLESAAGRSIQIKHEPLAGGAWVATHDDITDQRRAEQQVLHLLHYDALTNLPNRAQFRERLKQEMDYVVAQRPVAVHHIDIDDFKCVNDSLGYAIGDELLRAVAVRLNRCASACGFVTRLGADEFAIVQTGALTLGEVQDFVDKVLDALRTPFVCGGHQLTVDVSIGTALAPDHGSVLDDILKSADLAMQTAKAAGGRVARIFDPAVDAGAQARQRLEADLREAISQRALEIYYRPSVSLRDNRITGCEAVVRWRHPERGMIPTAEFIALAEETGQITQLGEWLLTRACADAASWPADITLAVNVSPESFKSGTLALKTIAALGMSGLPPERLELEIAEAALIRNEEAAHTILQQLRDIGVRTALDDFGSGYSSLNHLQRFAFDKVKIDRSFIKDIGEPDGSSSLVQAVIDIATARNMATAAEGVETETQRWALRKLGCAEMQGYLVSPARPAAEILELIAAHREAAPQRAPSSAPSPWPAAARPH